MKNEQFPHSWLHTYFIKGFHFESRYKIIYYIAIFFINNSIYIPIYIQKDEETKKMQNVQLRLLLL